MRFVHLHTHTEYSLLDGVQKIPVIVAKAKELGMNSLAMTDHGNLYGVFEFWKTCHEAEIKPIIGCEIYMTANRLDKSSSGQRSFHLPILAKNLKGYHNVVKLVSISNLDGFYYKPRVDKELLERYSSDLIILSGSQFGELRTNIELGNIEAARECIKYYKTHFKNNYYIELTPDLATEDKKEQLQILKNLSHEFEVPMVATANSYYLTKNDSAAQEVVWAISDGKKLSEPSRRKVSVNQYFRSGEKMLELWNDPEILDITQKIADEVEDYKIGYGKVEPKCLDQPKGKSARDWLRELSYEGAKLKFPDEKIFAEKVTKRLEYELGLIDSKGYNDYFLVVREYVLWSNNKGIPTSCRGSGASSLVAFCIGITPLDPLRWNLPFERLLNPERASFPDFDIDFADDRREEVFQHMIDKYSLEKTSNICAIGRLKSRAVLKDVGRVMNIPLATTEKLSKLVTVKFGKPASLKDMMNPELHPEFVEIVAQSPELQKLVKIASKIENNARHISTHACGFLYVPELVSEYIPIQKETRGGSRIITQIEGVKMEDLGLMKFDFLGVTNLSTIATAVDLVKKRHNITLEMRKIPEDDKATFELLQKTDTAGVFQLESDGMRKYLKDLKPTTVEDISFMCAAYRPGPMQFIEPYIRRKHGKEEVTYPHEDLKPVLEETYGYAIYQEQVMLIAQVFAGYTLGAADMLRRAMGKKKAEIMAAEKGKFIEGAIQKGHTKEEAEQIFSYLEPFADYGFNKAHSAAYAMIAYQTAYLKANYTIEFIAALMQCDIEKSDKLIRDIEEAKSHGIDVLPPDVNRSNEDFTIIDDKTILFGLAGLKGIGRAQVSEIVQARNKAGGKFSSLEHMLESIDLSKVSKSALELLSKVGALRDFGNRAQMLAVIANGIETMNKLSKQKAAGQFDLFGGGETKNENIIIPNLPDISDLQKVTWEKEILGVFLSMHPLIKYEEQFKKIGVIFSADLAKKRSRTRTKVVGIVNSLREVKTKKDGSIMCFGTLEDPYGVIPITIFASTYITCKKNISEGALVLIGGSIDKREDKIGILVNECKIIDESKLKPDLIEAVDRQMEKPIEISVHKQEVHTPMIQKAPTLSPTFNSPMISMKKEVAKIIVYLDPNTDISKLQNLSNLFKSSNGKTNLVLFFSEEKKVVLKNGIRYDEVFKEKILSIVPNSTIEEVNLL